MTDFDNRLTEYILELNDERDDKIRAFYVENAVDVAVAQADRYLSNQCPQHKGYHYGDVVLYKKGYGTDHAKHCPCDTCRTKTTSIPTAKRNPLYITLWFLGLIATIVCMFFFIASCPIFGTELPAEFGILILPTALGIFYISVTCKDAFKKKIRNNTQNTGF